MPVMKTYSLLIVLNCLGNCLLASEGPKGDIAYDLIEGDIPGEQLQERGIGRSIAKLNVFLQSLEICKTTLNIFTLDSVDPEISEEFQRHVDGIVAHIDDMQNKISAIMPYLEEAKSTGNLESGDCFESIGFDAMLDGFIRIENVALQWLKDRKSSLGEESYGRIRRALKASMAAALALKLVTIVGAEAGVFSCDSCCILL
jgi:hypothetical protein